LNAVLKLKLFQTQITCTNYCSSC